MTERKVDLSKGLDIIQQAEKADVATIENKIEKIEERDKADRKGVAEGEDKNQKERNYKAIFANVVVMGDSIAEALSEFDILNASSVISKIGVELDELDDQIEKVEAITPHVIFLAYGLNDIISTRGNSEEFVKQYGELFDKLQKRQPQAKVFVNSIFPVQQQKIDKDPVYKELNSYNKALQALCNKRQIAFIDNTKLVSDSYYEQDGVHFKVSFYPSWLNRMAEVASL